MILVDANLLLYAEDRDSPHHDKARKWWDAQLSGSEPVGLCWQVIGAFIRISTNHRIYKHPLSIHQAVERIDSWVERPMVRLVVPTAAHWSIARGLLIESQALGNLVSDADLAALAIEHGCPLYSTDADFSRFPKVKWINPL